MRVLDRIFHREKVSFLAALNRRERAAVSNLNPLLYDIVIKEKRGESTPTVITDDDVVDILRRLSIDEIDTLSKSVLASMQADQSSDPSEQARLYRRAAEMNPYNDLALMSCGCAMANQGDLREGIKWVELAIKVNPDNERARRNLQGMKAAVQ